MSNVIRLNRLKGHEIKIEPAPVNRDWMDRSPQRYAYRCLPLNIANVHGWRILCPSAFRVRLEVEDGRDALKFEYDTPQAPPAISHFGMGIVTFHVPVLITTPPGVSLYVTGPVNDLKPGAAPLSGVVETDWLPFTFTMNWRVYVRNHWIEFRKDEPFCMFYPVRLDDIESYQLEMADLEDDPKLAAEMDAFVASRGTFLKDLGARKPEAVQQKWQKNYFQGQTPDRAAAGHRTSLKLSAAKWVGDPDKAPKS